MMVMMFALPMYVGGVERGMHEFFRLVSMLICVPVAMYSGWPFYVGARTRCAPAPSAWTCP